MNKKIKSTISILLSLIFVFSMATAAFASDLLPGSVLVTDSSVINADDFKVIAYRGLSACAPENTLSAITLAGRSGCYGCELDVRPTLDGWVCFSDASIDSKTNGKGVVSLFTNSEIQAYYITKGNNIETYSTEKIPTVTEAVNACKAYGMKPYLIIKSGTVDEVKNLIAMLKAIGALESTTIISASTSNLNAVKNAGGKTALNATYIERNSYTSCKNNEYNGIYSLTSSFNDVTVMQTAVKNGIEVLCSGINDLASAEKFYKDGIKTVMSTSLVMHAPTAEKISYSILSVITNAFKYVADFMAKLFRKIIVVITGKAIEQI